MSQRKVPAIYQVKFVNVALLKVTATNGAFASFKGWQRGRPDWQIYTALQRRNALTHDVWIQPILDIAPSKIKKNNDMFAYVSHTTSARWITAQFPEWRSSDGFFKRKNATVLSSKIYNLKLFLKDRSAFWACGLKSTDRETHERSGSQWTICNAFWCVFVYSETLIIRLNIKMPSLVSFV